MLHEYRNEIRELKIKNTHFANLMEEHDELDHKVLAIEEGQEISNHFDLETLKKRKLLIKDEIYAMVLEYKNQNKL